jgi:serine/threonine protein kinase
MKGLIDSGVQVICDFGLSTIIDSTKRITSRAKAYVGTTSYKAPEIVKQACNPKWSKKVIFCVA